ncbi:type-1 angiotensin II receptor-associated protein isoform X1 [Camelus dromedarius]|uniref:type-1 angiotensin II receptor-associated protein isoform X1 n=1 Tax=Camelus dromedarius TaxID=9838 RepID=UPI0031199B81
MELPAVNLKAILLVHWLLTTWGCIVFSGPYAWANFTILALGVWAVAQRDSVDAISMVSSGGSGFWVAWWSPSSWTSFTSASSTRERASRTRSASVLAWPSSACSSSRSPAASSTTCTGSAGVSLDRHRIAAPTRRLPLQRCLLTRRAGVPFPKDTEASPAMPGPSPGASLTNCGGGPGCITFLEPWTSS